MGIINKAKGDAALHDAQHTIDAGRHVLVFKFIEANTSSLATGAMTGINDQIEAIESLGWKMNHMSVGEGKAMGALGGKSGERIAVICLFRR
ncbi:hypothetical protein [Streptomyces sp. NBC_00286]|uniref:hypothetical protein n=1 Tax=Streptomyces sp. NBC_00286 TaxID=2975701 RepID=UPI002E2C38D3|nr:hypothetical protein [Streptomyces sp. NBC_00286]